MRSSLVTVNYIVEYVIISTQLLNKNFFIFLFIFFKSPYWLMSIRKNVINETSQNYFLAILNHTAK